MQPGLDSPGRCTHAGAALLFRRWGGCAQLGLPPPTPVPCRPRMHRAPAVHCLLVPQIVMAVFSWIYYSNYVAKSAASVAAVMSSALKLSPQQQVWGCVRVWVGGCVGCRGGGRGTEGGSSGVCSSVLKLGLAAAGGGSSVGCRRGSLPDLAAQHLAVQRSATLHRVHLPARLPTAPAAGGAGALGQRADGSANAASQAGQRDSRSRRAGPARQMMQRQSAGQPLMHLPCSMPPPLTMHPSCSQTSTSLPVCRSFAAPCSLPTHIAFPLACRQHANRLMLPCTPLPLWGLCMVWQVPVTPGIEWKRLGNATTRCFPALLNQRVGGASRWAAVCLPLSVAEVL